MMTMEKYWLLLVRFHWNKIILTQALSGKKEDRLGICVTSPDIEGNIFLGSPVVESSEGIYVF